VILHPLLTVLGRYELKGRQASHGIFGVGADHAQTAPIDL
jgi:hypothetical protein